MRECLRDHLRLVGSWAFRPCALQVIARAVVIVCLLGIVSGCGRRSGYPPTAPVVGVVTMDGQPLVDATIMFSPSNGRSAMGKTDTAGRYELYYTGEIKGGMLGPCRVSISKQAPDPKYRPSEKERRESEGGASNIPYIEFVPSRYHGTKSELKAEVSDTQNVFNFDLRSQ